MWISRFYFFNINQSINFQRIPSTNIVIAIALMMCITLRLKLVGLLGSFFLKKYMNKFNKKKKALRLSESLLHHYYFNEYYFCLNSTRRFVTRPSSVELSAIGFVSP